MENVEPEAAAAAAAEGAAQDLDLEAQLDLIEASMEPIGRVVARCKIIRGVPPPCQSPFCHKISWWSRCSRRFGDEKLPKHMALDSGGPSKVLTMAARYEHHSRRMFVNLLTRELTLVKEPHPGSERSMHLTEPLPPVHQREVPIFLGASIFQETYIRFDFPEWPIPQEENADGETPKTGTGPMIIPFKDAHAPLILRGPPPLVSLLNIQSQVNQRKEFHVISVNARFLLFNDTPFSLQATAFAVRSPSEQVPWTMPPFESPAVRAATVVTEPREEEESGVFSRVVEDGSEEKDGPVPQSSSEAGPSKPHPRKEAKGPERQPYPLEMWHILGTGDGDFVPYLALSCPSSDENGYGCPLRLDLSENNHRTTVPLRAKGGGTFDVTLIVQLEDRENGQQMLVTVKEATSHTGTENRG